MGEHVQQYDVGEGVLFFVYLVIKDSPKRNGCRPLFGFTWEPFSAGWRVTFG